MEFFLAVFFLLFYFIRPQDWVPGLMGVNIIRPIIGVWLAALLVNRSRESPLPGILKTPHDWILLTYLLYVVWNAPDSMDTFKAFVPLVTFYALTVQSVNSWPRLISYLRWWVIALTTLATLGILVPLGIDPTGAKDYYEQFGRLILGTWIHHNPNSLGHSVIMVIPAAYFLFFWRGTALGRFVAFPIAAGIAFWCVYLTESKGAFLVGAILVVSVFVVGRPRIVQIIALTTALGLGIGALSFLPRMSQMDDLSADEGVQGRLMVWEIARGTTKTHPTGVGWRQFTAYIDWKEGDRILRDIPKATHSSYVQVGADLGRYGMFIYLAGLWCVVHSLLKFRPANDLEDRCRRIIWVLLLSFGISGWMINQEYYTEYFLIMAASASLHRLAKGRELELLPIDDPASSERELSTHQPESETPVPEPLTQISGITPAFSNKTDDVKAPSNPLWNRFGLLDIAVCAGFTWLIFWVWDYILENF
jgi:hypothetical protein